MTHGYNDKRLEQLREQLRAKRYREASEEWEALAQKRLKDIFPTFDVVRSNVEAGDRKAMLEPRLCLFFGQANKLEGQEWKKAHTKAIQVFADS